MTAPKTVDAYLKSVPQPARATLQAIRERIRELEPTAVEHIAYGMPAYKLGGRPLIYFAAFTHHCSLFPYSGRVLGKLAGELKGTGFTLSGKSALQFPPDKPIPKALIKKLIELRKAEIG